MSHFIVRNIPRGVNDSETSRELASLGVSTLSESQDKTGLLDWDIRPLQQGRAIAGPAITVKCFNGDNLMIHAAMELAQDGDILVVATDSTSIHGMFGELMSTVALGKGIAGLVTDSGVRDVKEIRRMGFPVWSRYISSLGTSKNRPGWVNTPINCGNQSVNPGDFVVADDDGVVVVRRDRIADVLEAANARRDSESKAKVKFGNGITTMEYYSLGEAVMKTGVEYREK